MNNRQMDPDAVIDLVLTGLAHVEASPEIEQRVLNAVQRRVIEQEGTRFAALSAFTHWQSWAIAACVVVFSFAASVVVRKRHEPKHDNAVLIKHTLPNATVAKPTEIAEARPELGPSQTAFSTSPQLINVAKPDVMSDEEALAISEMNAPSKPAPPLPLTHQERLLAEAVHQSRSIELSSLRPEVRAKQMELSKAEFHNFFESPPVKDNE